MLVVSDIIHQIVQDVVIFGNNHQLFQPVAADQKAGITTLIIIRGGNKPSECFNLSSF